jgi:hypothetical protein
LSACPRAEHQAPREAHCIADDTLVASQSCALSVATTTDVAQRSMMRCSELNPPTCASDDFKGTFRFRVSGNHLGLRLDPLITPEQRATALAAPNTFTDAVWMLSVADAGHTWLRRACDFCR